MTSTGDRCVITGLGMISAIGENAEECWKNALLGKSGIRHTQRVDTKDCYADYAAEVPDEYLADLASHTELDRAARLAVKAAWEAMRDAGLSDLEGEARAAVIMGSCVGGVVSIENYYTNGKRTEDIPKMPISSIASQVARLTGAKGVVTNIANACAAGTMSIAYAADLIRAGRADLVIAGGADAFASVPYAGFLSLHALDAEPCSPFNRSSGITLGEGAGAVIVESYEHAAARDARILCEVLGSGIGSDAYHITAPRPDGKGQMDAIRRAIETSGLTEADIGYVNAHGTGTAKNDEAELLSLHTLFDGKNENLTVSSTKGMTGHCLGAAGAIEAVFSVKALIEGTVPPTLGFRAEDRERLAERAGQIDFCPNEAKEKKLSAVMNNSFAFGGNNASIIFGKEAAHLPKRPEDREVVITGAGVLTPLGSGLSAYLSACRSDLRIQDADVRSPVDDADFAAVGVERAFYRKLDRFSRLQVISGMQALQNAGYKVTEENAVETGILVGTSEGALAPGCDFEALIAEKGNAGGSAFKFPNTVYNAAGGYLSIAARLRGYNVTVTNGAQSGLAAIAHAALVIRDGKADAMLAAGSDENGEIIGELYHKLGLVSSRVPEPYAGTEGFALSDGSVTLLLEEEKKAAARGAEVLCRVSGFGQAHHAVPFGKLDGSEEALVRAVREAVISAELTLSDIDAVIGFSDGQRVVCEVECRALSSLFGDRLPTLPILSVKERVGEARAAAAALGALHAALLLHGDLTEEKNAYRLTPSGAERILPAVRSEGMRHLLVLSFGSGGSYTALVLSR